MNTIELICKQFDFNLAYAKKLVEDLTEEQMVIIPSKGLENHPAFTLGHLATASAMTVEDLGGEYNVPEGWHDLFTRKGPGDPRLPGNQPYPAKQELLGQLELQHNLVKETLINSTPEKLAEPLQWRFSAYMPTLLDEVAFMCINHEAMHLSQVSAWRRAMGLPSALGNLK